MKILHRNLKEGKFKLRPENIDDLWYLKSIIEEGDAIYGVAYRRVRDEERVRADKGERVRMFLGIKVKQVEFAPYAMRLRITGEVFSGPEDLISFGTHQTLEVKPGDEVMLQKQEWRRWHLERLAEAEKAAKEARVLIVAVEDGEAEFALIRRYGIDYITRIVGGIAGKRYAAQHEASAKQFYAEVAKKISEVVEKERVEAVVLAGPGFWKESLLEAIKERYPKLAKRCYLEGTGCGGRSAVQEVLKRRAIERILEESRISEETALVERFYEELAKEGLAAYGIAEVSKAMDYGAVETLLISDAFLRKYPESDSLIEKAKAIKAKVLIVSTEHEAGERLEAIGGLAAILRYRV
ncbi:mRNA surveillance protein pelota [Candidatus Pyrohabitans sp.]